MSIFFTTFVPTKMKKEMSQAELQFLTRVPTLLGELVSEIEKLNKSINELKEEVKQLKGKE